jgi:DNA-binding MarR family transcriptional regulator
MVCRRPRTHDRAYAQCVPASKYLPPPTATDTALRLRAAVARIDRLLAREVLGSALTRTQFSVLGALARQGQQRLSALADREGLNPTMLSRVVGALEKAGWVERTPDPGDGRAVVAAITGEGRQRYEQLQADRSALVQEYLDGLDADDAARLAAALPLLEGLAEHLREHHRTGAAAR